MKGYERKKVKWLYRFLALVLVVMQLQTSEFLAADDVTVTIYHTNDIHGNVEHIVKESTQETTQLGLDHVAALKTSTKNALLIDAGDYSQGNMYANLTTGESVIKLMNAAGYDLAALGNHEFDYTIEELDYNISISEFTVLSANIIVSEDMAETYPHLSSLPLYEIKEAGGKKIAFFSLNTPELSGLVNPKKLRESGISIRTDIVAQATEIVTLINSEVPDVDAIVAVTHTGFTEGAVNESSYEVAGVEGVDVVIDGHDHTMRLGDTAKNVNGTLVVSTGTAMKALGKLELNFTSSGLKIVSSNAFDAAKNLEPVKSASEVFEKWNSSISELKSQIVFTSEVNLWGGNVSGYTADGQVEDASIARRGQTNAADLMTDSRIWKAKNWLSDNFDDPNLAEYGITKDIPIVTILGGGSVRGSALAGDITLEDMMRVYSLSFRSGDSYVLVNPKILYDAVEHGVNIFSGQDARSGMLAADGSIHGRFPQPGGFTYEYDITQPKSGEYDKTNLQVPETFGSRVLSITLDDGTVLDRNDTETLLFMVTSDYEIGGGDGYWMLGALNDAEDYGGYMYVPQIATVEGTRGEEVINYVRAEYGEILPAEDYPVSGHSRITRVNDPYKWETFTSELIVLNEDKSPAGNVEFTVYINSTAEEVVSDAVGRIFLELPNGPNEVRLISETAEFDSGTIYLDNYSGLHNAIVTNNPGEILPLGSFAGAAAVNY